MSSTKYVILYTKQGNLDDTIDTSLELGMLDDSTISFIRQNIPSIKEIHLTRLIPTEANGKPSHITIVFDDNSRAHWWYTNSEGLTIPRKFSRDKDVYTNFLNFSIYLEGINQFIGIPRYLLTLLYDNMKGKTGTYGEDIRDINTYIGNLLPLQSETELDQYGTQIEPIYGELVPYTAPAAASTTNPYLPLQSETELNQYGTHIGPMYGELAPYAAAAASSTNPYLPLQSETELDQYGTHIDSMYGERGGGSNKIKKSHKRKSHKRKSHKRKSHKRKLHKRKSHRRK
jgi:hypothetical protein